MKEFKVALPRTNARYQNYANALEEVGLIPFMANSIEEALVADALLLPGGADVDPSLYHKENLGSVQCDKKEDEFVLSMIDAFLKENKPVFGICRGEQILNVYFGGTLVQDLDSKKAHQGDLSFDPIHEIHSTSDNWLKEAYGSSFIVNSNHHQAVEELGKDLVVDAFSFDGVVEAFHHKSLPVVGVQFHPERMSCLNRREDTVDGLPFFALLKKCIEKADRS